MGDKSEPTPASADPAAQWVEMWQTFAESSKQMADAWSGSMGPFMLGRLMEKPAGFTAGDEMSEAIEKMAQGPRLADVWDIDRKMALVFGAWMEMRQKLSVYNAVTSAPWNEASKRFVDAMSAMASEGKSVPNWREAFAKWSEISNEELIRNQRYRRFLAGAERTAAGGTEAAQPAGRRGRGRLSHVRTAEPEGFRRRDAPAHRTQAGGSRAQPSSRCKEAMKDAT